DAVEDESDAHAGREEHREPRDEVELRLLAVTAQRDVAEATHGEEEREDDEGADGEGVEPAEATDDAALDGVPQRACRVAPDDGEQGDPDDDGQGRPEDPGSDVALAQRHTVGAQLLPDPFVLGAVPIPRGPAVLRQDTYSADDAQQPRNGRILGKKCQLVVSAVRTCRRSAVMSSAARRPVTRCRSTGASASRAAAIRSRSPRSRGF